MSSFTLVRVDPQRLTIQKSYGLFWLIPLFWKKRPIENPTQVMVEKEVRTSSSGKGGRRSYTVFPVSVKVSSGEGLGVMELNSLSEARSCGEELAKAFSLPLLDKSSGEDQLRNSDQLDTPLGTLLREKEGLGQMPRLKLDSKLNFEQAYQPGEPDRLTFPTLLSQSAKMSWGILGLWSFLSLLLVWHWWGFPILEIISSLLSGEATFKNALSPFLNKVISFFTFILLIWYKLTTSVLTRGIVSVTLELHRDALTVVGSLGPLKRSRTLEYKEMEELHFRELSKTFVERASLVAVSDRRRFPIVEFHPLEDVRFAEELIKYKISRI